MRLPRLSPAVRVLAALSFAFLTLFASRDARAQRDYTYTPLGDRGTLVLDQLAGFRASTIGGVGYASPIGFSTQNLSSDVNGVTGQQIGTNSIHYTNVWFSPNADLFVINHLSVGLALEITSTSSSTTTTTTVGTTTSTTNTTLPTVTTFTLLPRVGWMFGITDRFGIWPRLGLGYSSHASAAFDPNAAGGTTNTFSGFVVDLDAGFLYRLNENFFLKLTPEVTFVPGSLSVTTQAGNASTTTSTGANYFQFALAGGVGAMFDLF